MKKTKLSDSYGNIAGVIDTVRSVPNHLGRGVIWWAPEWIPTKGIGNWSPRTLFDDEGNALPALDAFKSNSAAQTVKKP